MAQGTATGTAASVEMLAVSRYRDRVTFQMTDASAAVYFGFNTAAVVGEGIGLRRIGDYVTVGAELARGQINIIGNGGIVSYQTGNVIVAGTGPVVLPAA